MIFTSITRSLMASLAMFSTFSKLRKSATDVFAQKKFLEDIFKSEICYTEIRLISSWTASYNSRSNRACTVISNRPRASRSSDFEITRTITP